MCAHVCFIEKDDYRPRLSIIIVVLSCCEAENRARGFGHDVV